MKFSYSAVAALLIHATGCSGIDSLRPRNLYQADVSIVNNTDFTLTTKLQIEPTASVDGCEPGVKYLEAKIPAKETAELSTRMRCQHDPRGVIRVNGGGVLKDRKDAFIRIKGIYNLEDLVIRDDSGVLENLVIIDSPQQRKIDWQDGESITFADWSEATIFLSHHERSETPSFTDIYIVANINGSLLIDGITPQEIMKLRISNIPLILFERSWRFGEKTRNRKFQIVCDENECRDF